MEGNKGRRELGRVTSSKMRHYRDAMRRLEVSDELADIGET